MKPACCFIPEFQFQVHFQWPAIILVLYYYRCSIIACARGIRENNASKRGSSPTSVRCGLLILTKRNRSLYKWRIWTLSFSCQETLHPICPSWMSGSGLQVVGVEIVRKQMQREAATDRQTDMVTYKSRSSHTQNQSQPMFISFLFV